MTLNELDDKSQVKVFGFVIGLGTALFAGGFIFFEFFKNWVSIGWYVGVPIWIVCLFVAYPLAFAAAQAATTCEKCGTAWAKHQTDEKDIQQIFPRTKKEGDKLVHYEVTRFRIYHECNSCGHRTHKDKEESYKLH